MLYLGKHDNCSTVSLGCDVCTRTYITAIATDYKMICHLTFLCYQTYTPLMLNWAWMTMEDGWNKGKESMSRGQAVKIQDCTSPIIQLYPIFF